MQILRFALLGVATGAVYALLAQGLVLVYRGSGLLNFAQGALAMVGAYVYYEVSVEHGQPKWLGLIVALIFTAALGAAIHLVVLRPMRRSSPLNRVIATLGLLLVLQSIAFLVYGHDSRAVPSLLPTGTARLFGNRNLIIGQDRLWLLGIGVALTVGLILLNRLTPFGRLTTAVAENQLAAATLGHSPDFVAAGNWALGSALAGLAGVLLAPIIYLEPTSLVLLVLPAMSAALVGGFSSFAITAVAAIVLGIAQSEIGRYVSEPGWPTAAPFLVVIAILLLRGKALPLRGFVLDRLPAVGTGRIRIGPVAVLYAVLAVVVLKANDDWSVAIATTLSLAVVALSVVVITGYAGQLSLAQAVLAGVGALIAARFAAHMPFVLAVILAALLTALVGGVVGLPALRTRGITLAIVTLGLGGAVYDVVIGNPKYTGGVDGITVPSPHLFGWSLDPLLHSSRYAFFTLTVLALIAVAVANLRRGATGRRLLAVRSNERAAAALGVNNAWIKSYAFMIGAGIAAVGGALVAFLQGSVEISQPGAPFDVFTCIVIVAVVVAGGVGSVGGALLGSMLIAGGIASQLFSSWSSINDYLPLIGGLGLVLILMFDPDGLFSINLRMLTPAIAAVDRRLVRFARQRPATPASVAARVVAPKALTVQGLSVSFGGVHAVQDVSFEVRPGEVHGLIGPNGAGKTTVIDAITGFVSAQTGTVTLGKVALGRLSPRRRSTQGLSRSFQTLELFDDLSIVENLAVAAERPSPWRGLLDLVRPGHLKLSPAALLALREFELEGLAERKPRDVSFGQRKTVAIARAIAAAPSILLLDEPAAGLDDHEAAELGRLIRSLATDWGIGVLLVEHKVDLIMAVSDRVTVLQNGAVLASGLPQEIRRNTAVLDAYLGTSGALEDDAPAAMS